MYLVQIAHVCFCFEQLLLLVGKYSILLLQLAHVGCPLDSKAAVGLSKLTGMCLCQLSTLTPRRLQKQMSMIMSVVAQ